MHALFVEQHKEHEQIVSSIKSISNARQNVHDTTSNDVCAREKINKFVRSMEGVAGGGSIAGTLKKCKGFTQLGPRQHNLFVINGSG